MLENSTLWALISLSIIWIVFAGAVMFVSRAEKAAQAGSPRPGSRAYKSQVRQDGSDKGVIWIVVNPTKPDNYKRFRTQVEEAVLTATGRPPTWIETTAEQPGTSQAVEALRNKASVVVAAGGDGTVRAVAAGMAHSNVPMGLLPMGTGNLLARNLGLPLEYMRALQVILTPTSREMDLAWLRVDRVETRSDIPAEGRLLRDARAGVVRRLPEGVSEPSAEEYAYTVIAGVGFDGEAMAQTDPKMKRRVGWHAYFLTALKSLRIERMKATLTIFRPPNQNQHFQKKSVRSRTITRAVEDAVRESHTLGAPGGISPAIHQDADLDMTPLRARTILFANCGELPFAVLAPDASLDDGELDVIAIDTTAGLFGWALLSIKVLSHTAGLRAINTKLDIGTIQFRQTPSARADLSKPYPVQVDGDPIGTARTVIARVDHKALLVRVPAGSPSAIPDYERGL